MACYPPTRDRRDYLGKQYTILAILTFTSYAVKGFGEAGCPLGVSPRSSFFWRRLAAEPPTFARKKACWRAEYPLGAPPNLPAMDARDPLLGSLQERLQALLDLPNRANLEKEQRCATPTAVHTRYYRANAGARQLIP